MAGHARYTALLDACVLYPVAMTDALLSLATAGFFAAKWTTLIETEWTRSLERQRSDLVGKLDVRRDSMREAVPDWEVHESSWSALVAGLELPDPDDRHVLAAAIAGHADCIVTSNLKDFPAAVLLEYGIEAVDPDIVCCRIRWGVLLGGGGDLLLGHYGIVHLGLLGKCDHDNAVRC